MQRWHSSRERALMLRRWRQEISIHEYSGSNSRSPFALSPVPPTGTEKCHCYKGMGFLRKRKPLDCGKSRCLTCHFEKYYPPKARHTIKRHAIQDQLT